MKSIIILALIILFSSCGTLKYPYYSEGNQDWEKIGSKTGKKEIHALYLLGDAGELDDVDGGKNYVLEAAGRAISKEEVPTSLVYLGDNIYPAGLPKKDDPLRQASEEILNAQLALAKEHNGVTYFIPGNHDWNEYAKGGRKSVLRQEKYVEEYFKKKKHKVKFYPNDACGDLKVVKINKDLVFIFLDSQWWLQDWSKEKKMNRKCDIKNRIDLLTSIEEAFLDHKNDEIVVLMHHPIKSDGKHGGNFALKEHLFPLRELNSNIWLPLPIIGSIYPLFRKVSGSIQDIAHETNQEMMQGIYDIAKKNRVNVVFAAGHEHGLQFFDDDKIKLIISGSAAKSDFVKRGGDATYARNARGYVKITFYEDFEAWADFYTVSGFGAAPQLEYRTEIRAPRPGAIDEENKYPPVTTATKVIAANEDFAAGNFKKAFFGKEYRDMWATPVEAEVIDLQKKHGGLTPIKKGGGMASNSLRMEKENGNQYILRSIKKDYTKLIPDKFKNLKVIDVIKDQNSASHPYNALIIPKLSEAAGIFYTDPKLVYLKHQEGLGNYNQLFSEELYLLEERPSGDWSHNPNFGNSEDIIGYVDLLEILREKKRHIVDQKWVLKSRLFDLFIHDWDRHDDQWRWAKFVEGDYKVYRPIPRDRDQAFYKFEGIIPWYISTFLMKQLKPIKGELNDVKHLALNARHFDRYFMNELEWPDWEEIIIAMQENLSDEIIEESMKGLPDEVEHMNFDEELAEMLKSRRDQLKEIGEKYYAFLNREVEVHGSDRKDHFELTVLSDGSIELEVHVHYDDEELVKYERVFNPDITKEIRLYGLRGKDRFQIVGDYSSDIKIRIIGGEDDDKIINESGSDNVVVYDDLKGMKIEGKAKNMLSDDLETNEYDRESTRYNTNVPSIRFGLTPDDGFWLGGALNWVKHGWRREPYKSKQRLAISGALTSGRGFLLDYEGHFPNLIGNVDFNPVVDISFPHYENYFGIGNNTTNPLVDIEYHWVRQKDIEVNPQLVFKLNRHSNFNLGAIYQYRNIENSLDRVSNDEILGFDEDAFDARNYAGVNVGYNLSVNDDNIFPSNGLNINITASHLIENAKDENVTLFNANAQFYLKLINKPTVVLANQLGYQYSTGDLQFYQYADIGNNKGLRGYRNERFRGHSAFYHNIDLRMKLFYWRNNILPMDVGLLGGYDYGRVHLDNEISDEIHRSQTIGLWFDILDSMVLNTYYSFNEEENMFSLQVGFNF